MKKLFFSIAFPVACPGTKSPSLESPQYGGCEEDRRAWKRNIHSLRDWELLDALRILELGNCARIKSKGYQGLLFHCASRGVPRKVMQSAVYSLSIIGDMSATSRTSRKYSRVSEGEMDNVFRTRSNASIPLIRAPETAKLFIEFA